MNLNSSTISKSVTLKNMTLIWLLKILPHTNFAIAAKLLAQKYRGEEAKAPKFPFGEEEELGIRVHHFILQDCQQSMHSSINL